LRSSKSIVIYSDIHVGSTTAVCTPNPIVSETSSEHKPNALQRELYQIWEEAIDDFSKKPDLCVVNGEPVDGGNPKQLGNQSWSTNLYDQSVDSCKLLRKVKAKEYLFVRGSGYHVQIQGTPIENYVAEMMGGVKYSVYKGMQPKNADFYANVKCFDTNISFTHHIPYAKFFAYRATPISKESALMALDKGRNMKYDVIVRSHVHYFMMVKSAHTIGFTTPSWKYPDGHLFRGGLGGTFPDIGMVEMIIEPNNEIIVNEHITELRIKPEVYEVK
jgi:hypothetical protein